MAADPSEDQHGVPFPRAFGLFGYSVFWFIILAFLMEVASYCWIISRRSLRGSMASLSPVYDNMPWAREFWKEEEAREEKQRVESEPYRIFGTATWHGRYVNTDQTEMGLWRRTINPVRAGCRQQETVRVWVFGGSVVFGTGNPDSTTIPSQLSKIFNSIEGSCVEVTNLGVEGYVTNQEVILLIEKLKAGWRPSLAIFLDGANDTDYGAFPSAASRTGILNADFLYRHSVCFLEEPYSLRMARRISNRIRPKKRQRIAYQELASRARGTLQNYESNIRMVQALANAYHFAAYFFWQPALPFGKKPRTAFEQQIMASLRSNPDDEELDAMMTAYEEAARRSATSGSFVFLGGIFDHRSDPIYTDEFHLGPLGNEIVANAIEGKIGSIGLPKSLSK